jgi:hypothetical protein
MTDRAQFEAMLEALINENHDEAKAIFHNIVVGKSREIYEELLSEDFSAADANKAIGGHTSEGIEDGTEEPAMEEADDAEADDAEDDGEEADDAEDDSEMDMDPEADDEFGGDEEGDAGGMEDRVMDLEDALEDLKAEFEQLMAGEDGEEMGGMDDMGGDMAGDEMGMDAEPEMGGEDELTGLMEYVNKVGGQTYNTFGKMGDNGQNTKSIVAGKNDMGGTTANIAKSFSTEKGGTQGGLANPKAGDLTSGLGSIHNRKDSNAGKTAFKKKEPGHGAEKKGAGEKADNTTSMLNGAPKRAK